MTASFEIIAITPSPLVAQIPVSSKQDSYQALDSSSRFSSIALAAAQSGYLGIFDLAFAVSAKDLETSFNRLLLPILSDQKYNGLLGVRLSARQLDELTNVLTQAFVGKKSTSKKNRLLTIIMAPDTVARYMPASSNKLAESIRKIHNIAGCNVRVLLEVISASEAKSAVNLGADALIAKGHEASGFVGEQTAFVLLQECLEQVKTPVYVWGGIGLHTAAACYVAGAAGVIFDSQLWLTRESPIPLALKAKIEQFDGTESHVLSLFEEEQSGKKLGLRIYARPNYELLLSQPPSLDAIYEQIAAHNAENDPTNWIVPIGQDIAFAKALAQKYLSVAGILHAVKLAVDEHVTLARSIKPLAAGSPLANSHGTKYPILQGAMTRVSDKAQFAQSVAKAGGLPFLALALMRGTEAEPLLKETQSLLSDLPWGVGVLGFVPTELRQEQMAALKKYKPPYVLIAGGRPDQAKQLEELGIKTYLHVPSPLLLDSFMEMGCRRFIFEGRECGGHVGPRSSFVLWETMIDHLLNNIGPREDASAYHIIFAGGIHDARSSAAVAAMAAPLAARGLKIGVLMGTAYLFTEEVVNSGAIVKTFQKAALDCQETVLLETGPGHAIRCVNSPYKQIFDRKRRSLMAKGKSKEEIREELEFTNLGRLRLASKGLIRADAESTLNQDDESTVSREQIMAEFMQPENAEGAKKPEVAAGSKLKTAATDKQWEHGMYMIGQIASMHKNVVTINALHEDVSEASTRLLEALPQKIAMPAKIGSLDNANNRPSDGTREAIAIVGMSCLFPKAKDLHTFWRNILDKVDTIEEVPLSHWDWRNYYDADPLARDKIYSKWGGFLEDVEFDPTKYGIPPGSLSYIDSMQLLLLEVTDAALKDAGYSNKPFAREKTSVILANAGHGPITAFYSLRSMLGWKLSHLAPDVKEELENMLPEWTEDTFPGYLGNVTAGRVCNRFDLSGVNFSIDAACASSLAALYTSMAELRSGNSDLVFLAASDTHNQPGDYLSFSKTHALSPDGRCKTFDATANGIVISEGIAMMVLKRLSDAERDGDKIYAVIRGIGGSSDGRDLSLTAPRPAGQIKALHRAYEDAGLSPNSVTLIEAHGTGTVAGDKAEVEALKQVFEQHHAGKQSCAIGSVKTMIGHTKATAGLASLIKVAKSLYHKVLPPTIGVNTPNPACHFETGPFYINSETRPWFLPGSGSNGHQLTQEFPIRRAGVSAFGFGGTNFHAVLEEYRPINSYLAKPEEETIMPSEIFVFNGNNTTEITRSIASFEDKMGKLVAKSWHEKFILAAMAYWQFLKNLDHQSPLKNTRHKSVEPGQLAGEDKTATACLAIVATSLSDLKTKLTTFREQMQSGAKQIKDPRGIYYAETDTAGLDQPGKLAFLFPGQGSQYPNMLNDLAVRFSEVRETFAHADQLLKNNLERSLCSYIFPTPTFSKEESLQQREVLTDTRIAQPALGAADIAALSLVKGLGIKADMVAGHSYGEYVALCAAGYYDFENLISISAERGKILAHSDNSGAEGAMAAVSCSPEELSSFISNKSITLANYNSPKQVVIAGSVHDIEQAVKSLEKQNIVARRIPVSQAFHTPGMKEPAQKLAAALQKIEFLPANITAYSNRQGRKYEQRPVGMDTKLARHTVEPVDFVKQINNMYNDGARVFLEIGPGNVLTNLAQSILENHPQATCISLDRQGRDGVTNLLHALAQLAVNGIHIDWQRLYQHRLENLTTFLDSSTAPDTSLSRGNKKLLYLVNASGVRLKGSETDNTAGKPTKSAVALPDKESTAPVMSAQLKPTQIFASDPVSKNRAINTETTRLNGNADQIMLQFQQTMQEMANSFLETQQRVMLAFLESQGKPDNSRLTSTTAVQTQSPIIIESEVQNIQTTETPAATPTKVDIEYLINSLMEIVAERTGYPVDMIDPTLDLEADLGIDSIKRVEILNKFRRLLPESTQQKLEAGIEELAGTRTLQGLIDWLRVHQDEEAVPAQIGQLPISDGGGNGKHDAAINLEHTHGQRYIESTSTTSHAFAPSAAHAAPNGGNGKESTTVTHNDKEEHIIENQESGALRRALVAPVLLPKLVSDRDQMIAKMKEIQKNGQVALISGDKLGLSNALSALLKQYGFTPVILQNLPIQAFKPDDSQPGLCTVDLQNNEQVEACLTHCENTYGKIAMLFHLQSFGEESAAANRASTISLLHLLKYTTGKTAKQQRLITVTSMGGKFGIDQSVNGDMSTDLFSPTQAAIVGLVKVAAKELPASICKAIDFTLNERKLKAELNTIASQVLNESVLDESTLEVGYLSAERFGLSVVNSPAKHDLSEANLDQDSVVLITGGARGITAEIAVELSKHYKPTLILIGRSSLPEKEDPRYLGLTGARELKAKIIELIKAEDNPVSIPHVEAEYKKLVKDREIRNNIDKLKATAGKVDYHSLDVRDNQALTQLIESVYKEYGRIDAVIHSAGIIEDALIKDKATESFCRVFDTKVSSALTLLNTLKLDSLKYLFLFSSVVGRTGNAGQSDYVAANEVLNKLALAAQSKMSGRAASIMWGPWRGGMAQPELEEIFAQYGWSMIGVPTGCNAFLNELLCLQKTDSELLFVAELADKRKRQSTGARLHQAELLINDSGNRCEYIFELDPQQVDVFLQDHAFGDVPVVPMAYAIELMCEAACSTYPDLPLRMVENCEILAGILFETTRKKISIVVQEEKKGPNQATAQVSVVSGTTKRTVNYKARFLMGEGISLTVPSSGIPATCNFDPHNDQFKSNQIEANQVQLDLGPVIILPPRDEIFRKWLFQGPRFLGIQTINAVGELGIWGRVSGLEPERCLRLPPSENWFLDPVMFDSALQLAGIWARSRRNIIALPAGFRRLMCFTAPDCQPGEIFTACMLIAPNHSSDDLTCDLAVYKQSGELCLFLERLSGVDSKSLQRLAVQNAPVEAHVPK